MDSSTRILDFSKHFQQKSFQNQRSEFTLDSLPSLPEVDEMIKQVHRVNAGLERIRDSIHIQQQALAETRAYHNKMNEDEMNGYHEDFRGGFASNDAKKRRGVSMASIPIALG